MKANRLKIGFTKKYDHLRLQRLGILTVAHLADRTLSHRSTVDGLIRELRQLIETERPSHLLINFAFVAFCSSELINALIDFRSLAVANEVQLKVCGMRDEIRGVFQVLGLDGTMFDIHDSASGAVKAFSGGRRDLRSGRRRSFPAAHYA